MLVCLIDTHRSKAIDLIKEYDGRLRFLRLLEKEPQLALRFTDPLRQDVGPFAHEEGHLLAGPARLCGQCPRDQRLPRACRGKLALIADLNSRERLSQPHLVLPSQASIPPQQYFSCGHVWS